MARSRSASTARRSSTSISTPGKLGVGAAAPDGRVDGREQPVAVVGVHRGDDLLQRNAAAPQRRVDAEAGGEPFVDGEAVGRKVPEPGADDGARTERELHPLGVHAGALVLGRGPPLGQYAVGGLHDDGHHAEDGARRVQRRGVFEVGPQHARRAVAHQRELLVLVRERAALVVDLLQHVGVEVGHLVPAFEHVGAQQLGMPVAGERAVGVVVDHDALLSPERHDGRGAAQHEGKNGLHLRRPAVEGADGGRAPVEAIDEPAQFAGVLEERAACGSGLQGGGIAHPPTIPNCPHFGNAGVAAGRLREANFDAG
jgi:hypothetical protein